MVWPTKNGELSQFTGWMTLTHTQRLYAHRHSTGSGHVDQGQFKSFPVQDDEHFYTLCRYVERNALRAKLVERAEDWKCYRGVSMETRSAEGEIPVGGMALGSSSWLGQSSERPANGCGTGGLASQRSALLSARR